MAAADEINRVFREFRRYTGDGLPNAPLSAPLPVGDPQSGAHSPKKADIRDAFGTLAEEAGDATTTAINAAADAAAAAALAIAAADDAAAVGGSAVPNYATQAAAAAATIPAARAYVITAGYAVVGDGGAAIYKRVATQPTHGGKFRSVDRFLPNGSTDATNGGWWELAVSEVNVRMFGAAGDNTADDTAEIQAAFSFITINGGTVRFPAGTYKFSATLTLVSTGEPVKIVGDGHATSILAPTSAVVNGIDITGIDGKVQLFTFEDFGIAGPLTYVAASASLTRSAFRINHASACIWTRVGVGCRHGETNTNIPGWDFGFNFLNSSPEWVAQDCLVNQIWAYGWYCPGAANDVVPASRDWSGNKAQLLRNICYRVGVQSSGAVAYLFQAGGGIVQGNSVANFYVGWHFEATEGMRISDNYQEDFRTGGAHFKNQAGPCKAFEVFNNQFGTGTGELFTIANLHGCHYWGNLHHLLNLTFDNATCLNIDYGPGNGFSPAYGLTAETAWWPLTLQNSWVAVAGYPTPGYRKKIDGTVEFRGVIRNGTGATVAFQTHSGYADATEYAPTTTTVVGAVDVTTGAIIRLTFASNGNVTPSATTANGVSLSGIRLTMK